MGDARLPGAAFWVGSSAEPGYKRRGYERWGRRDAVSAVGPCGGSGRREEEGEAEPDAEESDVKGWQRAEIEASGLLNPEGDGRNTRTGFAFLSRAGIHCFRLCRRADDATRSGAVSPQALVPPPPAPPS